MILISNGLETLCPEGRAKLPASTSSGRLHAAKTHRDLRRADMTLTKFFVALVIAAGVTALYAADVKPKQITWNFDNLSRIGGLPVKVEGHPKVISSPVGKAIEFDGVGDSLLINQHPLAGAETFTF